jgi:23S rRNA G2069 N7-methylase RlmK/C1962 C5-methylase RlmI
MFAAKAGAKHVIGVDMSTIIVKAREIVEVNGLSDKITLRVDGLLPPLREHDGHRFVGA